MDKEIETLNKSYGRCCLSTGFLDTFYSHFIESSPKIRELFQNTDFNKQKQMLKNSISMLLLVNKNNDFAMIKVEQLANKHSRNELNIPPDLYGNWLESLITAIRIHDPQFTPEIEKLWRMGLRKGITIMQEKYINKSTLQIN